MYRRQAIGKNSEVLFAVIRNANLLKEWAFSTVVCQLSEENQLTLWAAIVLLAGGVFHRERNVIGLEVMYVEDCFEDRQSIAVIDVSRVHWALNALGALLFRRLYHQKVAHLFEVFLQTVMMMMMMMMIPITYCTLLQHRNYWSRLGLIMEFCVSILSTVYIKPFFSELFFSCTAEKRLTERPVASILNLPFSGTNVLGHRQHGSADLL